MSVRNIEPADESCMHVFLTQLSNAYKERVGKGPKHPQADNQDTSKNWTCEKYFDEARVQLDYILADEKAVVSRVWNDNMLPLDWTIVVYIAC